MPMLTVCLPSRQVLMHLTGVPAVDVGGNARSGETLGVSAKVRPFLAVDWS